MYTDGNDSSITTWVLGSDTATFVTVASVLRHPLRLCLATGLDFYFEKICVLEKSRSNNPFGARYRKKVAAKRTWAWAKWFKDTYAGGPHGRRLPASGVLVRGRDGRGASIGVSSAFHARGLKSGSLPHASHMTWYGEPRGLDFVQQQFGFEAVHSYYLQEIKKCPWHVVNSMNVPMERDSRTRVEAEECVRRDGSWITISGLQFVDHGTTDLEWVAAARSQDERVNPVTRQCMGSTHRLTLDTWISVYGIGTGRGVPRLCDLKLKPR